MYDVHTIPHNRHTSRVSQIGKSPVFKMCSVYFKLRTSLMSVQARTLEIIYYNLTLQLPFIYSFILHYVNRINRHGQLQ